MRLFSYQVILLGGTDKSVSYAHVAHAIHRLYIGPVLAIQTFRNSGCSSLRSKQIFNNPLMPLLLRYCDVEKHGKPMPVGCLKLVTDWDHATYCYRGLNASAEYQLPRCFPWFLGCPEVAKEHAGGWLFFRLLMCRKPSLYLWFCAPYCRVNNFVVPRFSKTPYSFYIRRFYLCLTGTWMLQICKWKLLFDWNMSHFHERVMCVFSRNFRKYLRSFVYIFFQSCVWFSSRNNSSSQKALAIVTYGNELGSCICRRHRLKSGISWNA